MSAVFADVDTGIDDAVALIYLLASDIDLIGIASTGGNIPVDQVCANNLGLLELCKAPDVPVFRGAEEPLVGYESGRVLTRGGFHGPTGLGYAELPATDRRITGYDAATAWVRAAHAHPGELIGVATGPLTNLALALRAEPALPRLLRRLVIMGGAFGGHPNMDQAAESNMKVDPEAAAEVFSAWAGQPRLPVVCGLNLTRNVAMTPDILVRLSGPSPVGRFIEEAVRFYFEVHRDRGLGYLAYLHDPLAAAVALDPALVTTRAAAVDVDLADARGTTIAYPPQVSGMPRSGSREPNARIGIDVDPAAFFDLFIDRIATFTRRLS